VIDLITLSRAIASFDKRSQPVSKKLCTCSEAELGVIHLPVANGSKVRISGHPHRENAAVRTGCTTLSSP
jgi:hypothetical protein